MTVEHRPFRLAVLPGDGVGPEVTAAGLRVLETSLQAVGIDLVATTYLIGGAALDATGEPLPNESLEAARTSDAVLLGAVGGPAWDHAPVRPEAGLLRLRAGLEAFANLRPIRVWPGLEEHGTLRPEVVRGVDLLFVRELTGGIYFGRPKGVSGQPPQRHSVDTSEYSEGEIRRTAEVAFRLAQERRSHLTSVDKANVMATSQLWREVVAEVGERFPEVTLEHCLVDSFALRLLQQPGALDVVVTENLFGDILTDEAAALTGSLGVIPSASGGGEGPWLYEPVHGSAPDIASRGIANPLGSIAAVALLLRLTLHRETLANALELAVGRVIAEGRLTPDLGGSETTDSVTEAVLERLVVRAPA
ncbi:MAG: 3-isopropylmalate dehydrogenase [Candidatus Dormiibacterota bacterium]